MYKVYFSKKVIKFLHKKNSKFKNKFVDCFCKISKDPFTKELNIKALKGGKNHYRLRIAKYRILFEIKDDNIILCYDADSRGSVYNNLHFCF